jgi:putative SOS response-associated peptidase YedK
MCGRYTLSRVEEIQSRFGIDDGGINLRASYNVAPDQVLPVVVRDTRNRLKLMKWGLIPFWSRESKSVAINARIEGILSKPSFRKPIHSHRCLVPATGYYEWKGAAGEKTPYYIRRKDERLFAFAGISDAWEDPDGNITRTFAIITTAPNDLLAEVHNRMPFILEAEEEDVWLGAKPESVEGLLTSLKPVPGDQLEMYPVSKMVNWVKNDSPDLVQRV